MELGACHECASGSNLAFHVDSCSQIHRVRIFCGGQVVATAAEQTLLAEVVALRAILLNALYKLAPQEDLTDRDLDRLIERADMERFHRAKQRLAAAAKEGKL